MAHQVDVVVIGTGSAGSTVAYRCRRAGWSVAIVDKRPYGGTCALRGCDPKKVLVGAAEAVDWGRRMQGKGVAAPGLAIDWPELMRFKASFTDHVPPDREEGFRAAGIATYHGTATFVGPTTVRVDGEALTGRYVVIAAGARPQTLGIPGEEHLVTSERFLSLPALPRRILFVGGGYIAAEFAHIVARAGAEATIVHRGPRPLERFDPDLVAQWQRATEEAGIRVELGTAVAAVERRGESFVVTRPAAGRGGPSRQTSWSTRPGGSRSSTTWTWPPVASRPGSAGSVSTSTCRASRTPPSMRGATARPPRASRSRPSRVSRAGSSPRTCSTGTTRRRTTRPRPRWSSRSPLWPPWACRRRRPGPRASGSPSGTRTRRTGTPPGAWGTGMRATRCWSRREAAASWAPTSSGPRQTR